MHARCLLIGLLLLCLMGANGGFFARHARAATATLNELNASLKASQAKMDVLEKKSQEYQGVINQKQKEARTLVNEVAKLNATIAERQTAIEIKQQEIVSLELQVKILEHDLGSTRTAIDASKSNLRAILSRMLLLDYRDPFITLASTHTFADFYTAIKQTSDVQASVHAALLRTEAIERTLDAQKTKSVDILGKLNKTKDDLENAVELLTETKQYKNTLLRSSRQTEAQYQARLTELKKEQNDANNEIVVIEQKIREKLKELGAKGPTVLSWPVPGRQITAYFHDPSYPFRTVFEHPAIDIRARQGTPINAPADGIVGRAKDAGMGYSYILLVHNNGISTVFGHVSRIDVTEGQQVQRGQVIGLTGGQPGTRGAGNLTTGPHLHMEVRLNGSPVDPLKYLP